MFRYTLLIAAGAACAADFPFTKYPMGTFGPNNVAQTALADIDKDGDLDFVDGKRYSDSGEAKLVWWEYQTPEKWVRHDVGGGQKSNASGAALDIDGDGWIDLISGDSWFRNPQNPRTAKAWTRYGIGGTTGTGVEGLGAEEMTLGDVDGDGKPDLISAHKGWTTSLWHHIPKDPTQPWEEHKFGVSTNQGLAVADFDHDGTLDIVNGQNWYANLGGKGLVLEKRPIVPFPVANLQAPGDSPLTSVGDLDGDGDPDIAMCSHFGPDLIWAENADGGGGKWTRHDIALGKSGLHGLRAMDFDNDGDKDLYAGENIGKQFIYENDGKGKFTEHMIFSVAYGHQAQAGDVDGDGDLDIIGKPWDGGQHVYMQNLWIENGGKHPVVLRMGPAPRPEGAGTILRIDPLGRLVAPDPGTFRIGTLRIR